MLQTTLFRANYDVVTKQFAGYSLLIAMSAMFFSMQTMNKFLACSLCLLASSKDYRERLKQLFFHPLTLSTAVFVALLTVRVVYSHGTFYDAFRAWDKYLKILYLILFLPLFETKQWQIALGYLMLTAIVCNELLSYLHYFNIVSFDVPSSKHWLFIQDIDASFILAFMAFWLLNLMLDVKKLRWLYAGFFVICFFDLFFMNQERTGYLIFFVLLVLFFWQRLHGTKFLLSCLCLPLVLVTVYVVSTPFNTRIKEVISDLQSYKNTQQLTSIGYRIIFAKCCLSQFKKHYIVGLGTGSFIQLYNHDRGPKLPGNTTPGHPHNEYLFIALQLGLVGLCAFLAWLYIIYQQTQFLVDSDRHSARGLLLAFVMLGFCNCSLFVSPAGVFFVILMSAFLAENYGGNL